MASLEERLQHLVGCLSKEPKGIASHDRILELLVKAWSAQTRVDQGICQQSMVDLLRITTRKLTCLGNGKKGALYD